MMDTPLRFIEKHIQYFLLAGIIAVGIALRWISADFAVILDYDPWWFYRHAQEIYDNNFVLPRWDILSHYPPGRPVDYPLGWSYTIAAAYALTEPLHGLSLMKFAGLFVAVFGSLSAVPAYFAGRIVTNRWGALILALLVSISPNFLVVSMAGFPDSDAVVVFYTFLAILTTLYAIKKADKLYFEDFKSFFRSLITYLPYLTPALLAYWLFSVNWSFSWYIYLIFLFFIPVLILFRLLEAKVQREKGYLGLVHQKIRESRNFIIPIILIGLFGELVTMFTSHWPYNTIPLHQQLIGGLSFLSAGTLQFILLTVLFVSLGSIVGLSVGRIKGLVIGAAISSIIPFLILPISPGTSGEAQIVNLFIAELQPVNLFTLEELERTGRIIGGAPLILGGAGIIALTIFKLIKKREITPIEYFAILWMVVAVILMISATRFSLQLAMAGALAAGLVIGNFVELLKGRKKLEPALQLYGLTIFLIAVLVFADYRIVDQSSEALELPQSYIEAFNWLKENADREAMVVTWWDMGHIITGFTGLKVHTDGAHCNAPSCIPYGLNTRIVDMGKILSTSNENEALDLLGKYTALSPEECAKVKQNYGSIVPEDACKTVSEVFIVVYDRLVLQYPIVTYYGSSMSGEIKGYNMFELARQDTNGTMVYGDDIITIEHKDDLPVPFIKTYAMTPSGELESTRTMLREVVFFDGQGTAKMLDYSNSSSFVLNDLLWLSPDSKTVILADEGIKDSMFTKLFFLYGRGLEHFELVFQNQDVKIYKVI